MGNAFEESMHQGFSRADLADEMLELERRIESLGCRDCAHMMENSPVCNMIIHSSKYGACNFRCQKGGNANGKQK